MRVRQTIRCGEICEFIAVESRQTFIRTDPEIASRIAIDLVDVVMREAIGGAEGFDRQAFCV